jgi:thioredoxin reductase (NADPH)
MDEQNYLVTNKLMETSVKGVYAAGEIQDSIFRQVATSVGQGTAAAMSAIRYLETIEEEVEASIEKAEAAGD